MNFYSRWNPRLEAPMSTDSNSIFSCTDGLQPDIQPIYLAASRQNRTDINALLDAHRNDYGECEQIVFAANEGAWDIDLTQSFERLGAVANSVEHP